MCLGKRIVDTAKSKGITQRKLAETVGVTPQSVQQWANGKSSPSIDKVPALAALLGVTIDELLSEDTAPCPPNQQPPQDVISRLIAIIEAQQETILNLSKNKNNP